MRSSLQKAEKWKEEHLLIESLDADERDVSRSLLLFSIPSTVRYACSMYVCACERKCMR